MRVLGLSAKKKGGKDAMFRLLSESGLVRPVRVGFADPIKEVCIALLGVPRGVVYGEDAAKEAYHVSEGIRARDAMKVIGKAIFDCDPGCINRRFAEAVRRYDAFGEHDLVVCPDVRFPREVDLIRSMGGKVVRLLRGRTDDAHCTEVALDGYAGFDAVIDNREQGERRTFLELVAHLVKWGWIDVPR